MRQTLPTKEGVVVEALPGLMFRVKLDRQEPGSDPDALVLAHLAGKMKIHNIRVLAGDRVMLEMSPDGAKGRIVRRFKI